VTTEKTAPTDGGGAPADAAVAPPVRNLHQRLAAVAKQVGSLAPSGKDQYGKEALSIYDVEEAVRAPLAEAGVITRWSYVSLEPHEKLWIAHLRVILANTDDPDDSTEDQWIDVGSNPMAATSFARKGYYKALFHLDDKVSDAEKGDRAPSLGASRRTPAPTLASPAPARQAPPVPTTSGGAGVLRTASSWTGSGSAPVSAPSSVTGETIALFDTLGHDATKKNSAWGILGSVGGWKRGDTAPNRFIPTLPAETQLRILHGLRELQGAEADESEPVAALRNAVDNAGDVDPDEIPF
jgi:hypothetical protein